MAVEQFPNGPTATLNGAIDNVTPTVVITPTAGTWPSGPQYRLLFVNTAELALVTGVSGNTLTCQRGIEQTTAVTHLNAEPLQAVPTGGGLTFAFARIDQSNAGPGNFTSVSATGLYSQVQTASRVVGSVAPGQGVAWTPAGGPYSVGDVVQDISNAVEYVCTVAGTPGTWIAAPSLFLAQTFTAFQTFSGAATLVALNRTDAAALINHLAVQRAGASKYWLGLDASDQFALLNAAANAINLGITDLGIATLRNALKIPPAAGGTLAPTNYGHVGVKIDEQTPAAVASVTIPAAGSLPTGFRHLRIRWKLKSSSAVVAENMSIRFNGSALANYFDEYASILNGVVTAAEDNNTLATSGLIGTLSGTTAPANSFGSGEVIIYDYNSATDHKMYAFHSIARRATGTSGAQYVQGGGGWVIAPVAITSVTLLATGNLTGTVETEGIP